MAGPGEVSRISIAIAAIQGASTTSPAAAIATSVMRFNSSLISSYGAAENVRSGVSRNRSSDTVLLTCGKKSTATRVRTPSSSRSEEHTSELQSLRHLVCRLLLEKKDTH